jgi:hypothetical protein
MTGCDVIAAGFSPGFTVDPTYWRVLIDTNRHLRQEVVISNSDYPQKNEVLRYKTRLSRTEIAALWEIIDGIAFKNFMKNYQPETVCSTDCATHWIKVKQAYGSTKEVSIYDLETLVEFEQNTDAVGFSKLWDAIDRQAPHGKVSVDEGRPRPWWQLW